jgi:hypothetical protein
MTNEMSSRERMLAALNCEKPDHVPMAFMIFSALNQRLNMPRRGGDPIAALEAQIELGLDTVVDLTFFAPPADEVGHSDAPGCPVRLGEGVKTRQWAQARKGNRYPSLHKEYVTPSGTLTIVVGQTEDWPYGDAAKGEFRIPLMDDYVAPRCLKYLVETEHDLIPLRHLLAPPTDDDLNTCRETWSRGRELARKYDLLLAGGWGVGGDALAWFCGLQNAVMLAIDEPAFLGELLSIIDAWNRPRMEAFLDFGVDLFVRRAWYEGTDFWSPALYRQFFFPIIREEVRLAHEAGAKYGYILTSGSMPLHEMLIELGVDVLIGLDPVQGKGTDLRRTGQQLRGKMCTWGGINGFITVEMGTKADIDAAVREAIAELGPDSLVLSPVDNIRDPSDDTWEHVLALIESWEKYRS